MLTSLAFKSLRARKITVGLTILSITISVLVLLSIHHIKNEAKSSFTKTVSGVDLIIGARTGQLNLLLYSVFRIGNAVNNISWDSYQSLAKQKEVAWSIPISLGDSHKGFRVMGTTESYFEYFSYGENRRLALLEGKPFATTFDAVLGADVAEKLGYVLGDKIILAHGIGSTSFSEHSDNPFTVVGILSRTGTPVDQTVHVRLDGIEAIHIGWESGVDLSRFSSPLQASQRNLTPKSITAVMIGLESKLATFSFQRKVNQFKEEALLAILPGVALAELWRMMGMLEGILLVISWMVLFAALIGMSTMMLAAMRERKQEFVVLRAIGARPWFILTLIQMEVVITTFISVLLALSLLWVGLSLVQELLAIQFGLSVSAAILGPEMLIPLILILCSALAVGMLPAIGAYRRMVN